MAALYSPALAATESRAARISARTCSSAPFSAFHSASGSPDEPVGISGSTGWKWRAEPERQPLLRRRRGACRALGLGPAGAELCGLPLQPAARFLRDLCEWLAEPRGYRRGHGSLDERGLTQEHRLALLRRQEVERGLGAQDGAPEIHQHEHAVAGVGPVDCLHDANRVGAESPFFGHAPGQLELHVGAGHLRRQLADALGQRAAMRDDHDSDHDYLGRPEPVGAVEELDGVDGVHPRTVLDLPAAGLAVAGGDVAVRLSELAEEAFAHRHRDLVLLLLQPIRAGDAATVGVELDRT